MIGSTFWDSVRNEIKKDFIAHPDLLLEAGLFNEVLPRDKYPTEWEKYKVLQIMTYHKVFDSQKLFARWCSPDDHTKTVANELGRNDHKLNISFEFKNDYYQNPINWMIASQRMALPCRFEDNDEFKLTVSVDNKNLKTDNNSASMLEIKPGTSSPLFFERFVPCRVFCKNGEYYLELSNLKNTTASKHKYALLLKFYTKNLPEKEGDKYTVKFNVSPMLINWHLLDCEQFACLMKIKDSKKNVIIANEDITSSKLPLYESICHDFNTSPKKVIQKLGKLQKIIRNKIPVPLILQEGIKEFILNQKFNNKIEAKKFYRDLKRQIKKEIRSLVVLELTDGLTSVILFLKHLDGNLRNTIIFKTNHPETKMLVQRGLDDINSTFTYSHEILSKSRDDVLDYLQKHDNDIRSLKNIRANSPEECRTVIQYKFLPVEDHFWYKTISLVLDLQQISPTEQWIEEAIYISREMDDNKRYYLASHEAMEVSPNNVSALLCAGWGSFKCERIKEAIEITKRILGNSPDKDVLFTANINLGLFHYWFTSDDGQINMGSGYYDNAFDILKDFVSHQQGDLIQSAIDDIETYSEHLRDGINTYLEKFRNLLI